MQRLCQVNKAYRSENLLYYLGTFTANKVNFTWFFTLILGLDTSTFRRVKGACSVILFEGAFTLKWGNRVIYSLFPLHLEFPIILNNSNQNLEG